MCIEVQSRLATPAPVVERRWVQLQINHTSS
jgi:hypothetical protein